MPRRIGSKRRRRLDEEEEDEAEEEHLDCISRLPDGVLGDIVSLLPTTDGARTQALSSRWRHVWRSAPLNIDVSLFHANQAAAGTIISRILSEHQGPGRRFSIPVPYLPYDGRIAVTTNLDGWLEFPALDGLQELEFHYSGRLYQWDSSAQPLPPLPASVHRFSSTLGAARFGGCSFKIPLGNDAAGLRFPVLKQLSLSDVEFSESSLCALLAACPVLQSLLLAGVIGCSSVKIVCPTLRSICLYVRSYLGPINLRELTIEDAISLESLLCFDHYGKGITVSVTLAPQLRVLGPLCAQSTKLMFGGNSVFQASDFVNLKMVMRSVKVLSLVQEHLNLDMVIKFMECFPYLEKLYIQTTRSGEENSWCRKYRNLIGTLDIRLKKIVLEGYRGNTSHVNFAKFFVLNARILESMRLQLFVGESNNAWIDKQHILLEIQNKASRVMQLDFLSTFSPRFSSYCPEQVHDLLKADPFS